MTRILPVVKCIFILLLLVAFLYLMARPNVDNKFIAGGIMVEVSTDPTDGLIAPAITFCAKNPNNT